MARPQAVIAHWARLFEEFQASPLEFYKLVERAVEKRRIPDVEISRVDWRESGILSVNREYLRVQRGAHAFDVCGAPFGTGFFISYWCARMEPSPILWVFFACFIGAALLAFFLVKALGFIVGMLLFVFLVPMAFKAFVNIMREVREGWDDGLVAIPYFGTVYEYVFRPDTYHKIDTAQMFQRAVHNAVMEAVDEMTAGKGVRSLSELERMPVMAAAAGK